MNDYASEFIDVRDAADAFVAALRTEEAGGERFILDAGMDLIMSMPYGYLTIYVGAFTYQNLCKSSFPLVIASLTDNNHATSKQLMPYTPPIPTQVGYLTVIPMLPNLAFQVHSAMRRRRRRT